MFKYLLGFGAAYALYKAYSASNENTGVPDSTGAGTSTGVNAGTQSVPSDIAKPSGSTSIPDAPYQPLSFSGYSFSGGLLENAVRSMNSEFLTNAYYGPREQQTIYYPNGSNSQMRAAMGRFGSTIGVVVSRERKVR